MFLILVQVINKNVQCSAQKCEQVETMNNKTSVTKLLGQPSSCFSTETLSNIKRQILAHILIHIYKYSLK